MGMSTVFAVELNRFGPQGAYAPVSLPAARAYCRRLALTHYENFSVASLLVPRRLLRHFHNIYAFCRWADDLGDETAGGPESLRLLSWWREELLRCYDGEPRHPVMIALTETVQQFHIPTQPFLDLISAFEQDQTVKRYETYDQLLNYCRRSADPVGHLVLYLAESFEPTRAALGNNVCTALQLANFWQDVARDFDIGRVYIPEEDRRRYGYSDDDLAARRFTPAFAELMRFEVERTRELFDRGLPLVEMMPEDLRIQTDLFIRGGQAVLEKLERIGYNVWRHRPTLSKWEKGMLLIGAWGRRWRKARIA